jgi:hypothetical protein
MGNPFIKSAAARSGDVQVLFCILDRNRKCYASYDHALTCGWTRNLEDQPEAISKAGIFLQLTKNAVKKASNPESIGFGVDTILSFRLGEDHLRGFDGNLEEYCSSENKSRCNRKNPTASGVQILGSRGWKHRSQQIVGLRMERLTPPQDEGNQPALLIEGRMRRLVPAGRRAS